ncbi:MAG: DNA-3-methyladenine glycosylase I [Candidatus Magasanikbacteria bacterium CG11_big_fil_rev_8_21_14_0_20_39_34]|uniref:DNA-3-methyladenine glycosylase I n=1 Tax=Candidatus Magasanikbacteria bacterium CG11_big_fil_rev_8_21_14_0_20_39_34 TaxID=1974653 RepID=A0A2H0N5P3_9BACT|nr:MAG: DNA-3-methyladenine glycosylase I [Candidatus Magasanikbacteria bacterium CG11_big_fil_rev_8_21_14_0_20_39_34]
MKRCSWVSLDPLYIQYHDKEWGVPIFQDRKLFELLILEGAQAGLSWFTVLKKRKNYQKAFDNFNYKKIALYSKKQEQALLKNEGIIRNKLKISSTIKNAQVFLDIQKEFGSFHNYLWGYVQGKPLQNKRKSTREIPASTPLSDTISRDLKKRGMNFVGSTIIYAYLQAIGIVNDHEVSCFRYKQLKNSKTEIIR